MLTPDNDGSSGQGIVNIELQMGSVPLVETSNIPSKASTPVSPPPHSSASVKALLPSSPSAKKTEALSAAAKQSAKMLLSPAGSKAAVPFILNATNSGHSTSASQSATMQSSPSMTAALHALDAAALGSAIPRFGSSDKAAGSVDTAVPTAAPKNSAEPAQGNIAGFAQAAKLPIDPHSSNAAKGLQQAHAETQLVKTPFSTRWRWTEDPTLRQVGSGSTAEVFR